MLVYHSSFDIYHTAYRILKVLYDHKGTSFEKEKIRIIDFILIFPHDLNNIKVPNNIRNLKKLYKETAYNRVPNRLRTFLQIRNFFDTSIQCLITRNLINIEAYIDGYLKINLSAVDDLLKIELERNDLIDHTILKILYDNFLPLSISELIERTALIDNKYAINKN